MRSRKRGRRDGKILSGKQRTQTLTAWIESFLRELVVAQLVKKFSGFYGTRRLITMFTRARHRSLS
jgi:hypothetical protein